MPLSRSVGVFSVELWVTVIVVLLLIGLFMHSFNSTYDEVERLKPTRLAAVMEVALRHVHANWLAAGTQPDLITVEPLGSLIMSEEGYPVAIPVDADSDPVARCASVLTVLSGNAYPKIVDGWPKLETSSIENQCHYRFLFEAGHSFELQYDTANGKVAVLLPDG